MATVSVRVGQVLDLSIYGKPEPVRVLALGFGTLDVERLSDGRCFRVSGLYAAR